MSECSIAFQVLSQKLSGGGELVSDKTEAKKPSPHGVFRILDLWLFGACGFDHHRHLTQCEAKLDVTLEFACVKPALAFCGGVSKLEASELNRAVCEASVIVEHMVATAVVMLVSAFVAVAIVPDVCEGIHRLGFSAVQLAKEVFVDCMAVVADAASVKTKG